MNLIEFDMDPWLRAAEMLTTADEPERALKLLDCVPGYYRDNPPPALVQMRRDIEKSIFQVQDYMSVDGDTPKDDDTVMFWINNICRGQVVLHRVKEANSQGITPHLIDMGPGDYMLPLGLKLHGCKFTYRPILLEQNARSLVSDRLGEYFSEDPADRPNWFIAYEIIEHIWNPSDLAAMAWRSKQTPDMVFLSTPRYTFNRGNLYWRTKGQPHLRTYTPNEFQYEAIKLFQGYNWKYHDDPVMVLEGKIKDGT